MKKPSRMQAEAIAHIRGPALLIAGPGSGKTFVIIQRILSLVSKEHVRPDRILVLTFSKAAANEMKTRYENSEGKQGVYFGTFHAASYGILRQYMGYRDVRIVSYEQKKKAIKVIVENQGCINECDIDLVNDILGLITNIKSSDKEEIIYKIPQRDIDEEVLKHIISDYNGFLKDERLIDFDDMITDCVSMLEKDSAVRDLLKERFDHIIVDEFQDINENQYALLGLLENSERNIMAVGDDDQAIYAFRGSDPEFMKRFMDDHDDTKIFHLTENFRSPEKIVKASSLVISRNRNRLYKEFKAIKEGGNVFLIHTDSRKEEEDSIIEILKEKHGSEIENGDTAIILRTNAEVLIYDMLLKKNGFETQNRIPSFAGMGNGFIYEDIKAFLNFIKNGYHRADFIKFMNKPLRYIQRDCLLSETVDVGKLKRYYSNNKEMLCVIDELWKWIELASKLDIRSAIGIFRRSLKYDDHILDKSRNEEEAKKNYMIADRITKKICEVNHNSQRLVFPDASFGEEIISEDKSTDKGHKNSHGIYVMTMHMAKGLEFDNVILPDLNEGVIPKKNLSEKETEEERRLLYVAMTRAKSSLYLMYTEERNRKASRFLKGFKPDQIISSNSHSSRNS